MAKTRKTVRQAPKPKRNSPGKSAAIKPTVSTSLDPNTARIMADLNPAQKQAVIHGEGPLLIVAGAGTGKTRVITSRIAYLIAAKKARAEEILALTFTEKAAQEMEERVDTLVPYGFADVWIGTFHAFGDRILRDWSIELGLTSNFRVLTQAEQLIFLKEHLFDLPLKRYRPLGNPTKHLRAILTLISRAKDEDISPEDYLAYAEKQIASVAALPRNDDKDALPGNDDEEELAKTRDYAASQLELAKVYQKYQELMAKNGLIDFGDQIRLILNLLRSRPAVLAELQKKFRYILVDEFQDTNYSQFQLIKMLAGKSGNMTVVFDDDQAIYKWRGASISNIWSFKKIYPQAQQIVLTENYRSTQEILDTSNRLIHFNDPERLEIKDKIDKKLIARSPYAAKKNSVHLHLFDAISSEADKVAEIIEEKYRSGKFKLGEMAILVRNNHDSIPYLQALNMKGLKWTFSGSRGLYDKPEIRLCLSFLSVIADLHDPTSLYDLMASRVYEFPALLLSQLSSEAHRKHRSLFYLLGHQAEIDPEIEIDEAAAGKIKELLADLEYFTGLSVDRPTGEVLYEFLMKKGILEKLAERESPQSEQEIKNIAKFFEIIRHTSETLERNRIKEFVPYLDLLREAGDNPAEAPVDWDEDAVPVLTIHKAKGLEFPVVFMGSLVKGKFPVTERSEPLEIPRQLVQEHLPEGDYHLAEERRLFYVGMTRARQELYLLSSRDMGGIRERKISPFISEALDILPENLAYQKTPALTRIESQAPLPFEEPLAKSSGGEAKKITFSYQQLDDYETCPLKYKYVHILRVPIRLHHSIVYGAALHQAMQRFLQRWMAGRPMSEDELLRVYQEAWRSEGFISRQHEEQRFAAGQEALRRFYREDFPKDIPPTYVEKEFSCQIGDVKLIGRWDRVDVLPDGSAAIIDYKSSEIQEQKNADKRVQDSARSGQLGLYAIAYEKMNGVLPARLELRFLDAGLRGCAEPNAKHLAVLAKRVGEVAAKIREGKFTAKPEYQACRFCAYSQICPSSELT